MIREMAQLKIDPASSTAFEAAVTKAIPHFRAAKGCHGMRLERSLDQPGHYVLIVEWESVEAHMVDFRQSDGFQAWRGLVGAFFLEAPKVDHVELAVAGF